VPQPAYRDNCKSDKVPTFHSHHRPSRSHSMFCKPQDTANKPVDVVAVLLSPCPQRHPSQLAPSPSTKATTSSSCLFSRAHTAGCTPHSASHPPQLSSSEDTWRTSNESRRSCATQATSAAPSATSSPDPWYGHSSHLWLLQCLPGESRAGGLGSGLCE